RSSLVRTRWPVTRQAARFGAACPRRSAVQRGRRSRDQTPNVAKELVRSHVIASSLLPEPAALHERLLQLLLAGTHQLPQPLPHPHWPGVLAEGAAAPETGLYQPREAPDTSPSQWGRLRIQPDLAICPPRRT